MGNDDLDKLFENASTPEPNVLSRARIIKNSIAAFKAAQATHEPQTSQETQLEANSKDFQGSSDSPRLTDTTSETVQDTGSTTMHTSPLEGPIEGPIKKPLEKSLTTPAAVSIFKKRPLWFGSIAASLTAVVVFVSSDLQVTHPGTFGPSLSTQDGQLSIDDQPVFASVTEEISATLAASPPQTTPEMQAAPATSSSLATPVTPDRKAQVRELAIQREVVAGRQEMDSGQARVSKQLNSTGRSVASANISAQPNSFARTGAAATAFAGMRMAVSDQMPAQRTDNRDRFEHVEENAVKLVSEQPVSTFSIDVDTASYSFVRRQLNRGVLPAEAAVRSEEMINYFDYAYPAPSSKEQPFATHVQVLDSPWRPGNKLVHIGIKGYNLDKAAQPDSNLVFLLDVSGSMNRADKLPLVKQSMGLLLDSLKPTDTVSIVVYAGAAGAVLEPTAVKEKSKILGALGQLQAGGSTAGGQGLALAYSLAEMNFKKDSVNRIILATDGDFNVGITQDERLEDFVARKRDSGIYLSVLGFGEGNYQDARMQKIAQNGNGVAAYIDTLSEAQKILVNEATSTLFPIANDVKIQVEFNPKLVSEYRLIGYETRALKREDFNNDKVDAGDIGAGHTVTAVYEITPVGSNAALLESSRYQAQAGAQQAGQPIDKSNDKPSSQSTNQEIGFIKLRYKNPGQSQSRLISTPIAAQPNDLKLSATDKALMSEANFSVAVAGFSQILRGGKYTGKWGYDEAINLAQQHKGQDPFGYRTEFIQLVRKAKIAKAM